MLVDLDKVKKIINRTYAYNFTNIDSLLEYINENINMLGYGKLYQCINCNKDIYFDKECSVYRHVDNTYIACNGDVYYYELNAKIAIPKPDNNHALHGSCQHTQQPN